MKTFTKTLLLALCATTAFAQDSAEAPGAGLDLNSPPAPTPDGPLTPSISLETPSAGPSAGPSTKPAPVTLSPALVEALADHSKEDQQRFAHLLTEASILMQKDEIQASLEKILEAEAIEADFFALHNLKGAAFSKIRDFEKAVKSFKRCIELNPDSMEARFNLAEMDFVQKNYAPAYDAFSAIMDENPKMPAHTRNLLLYKKYLCLLLLDRSEDAEAIRSGFRFDSDTPEYYYANAAHDFHKDNTEDARGWLRSAGRIYDQSLQNLFLDSLVEIGWIETF